MTAAGFLDKLDEKLKLAMQLNRLPLIVLAQDIARRLALGFSAEQSAAL